MKKLKILTATGLFCVGLPSHSAIFDINSRAYISCLSDDATGLVKIGEYEGDNAGDKLRAAFFKWIFAQFDEKPIEQIDVIWDPNSDTGSKVELITQDSPYHNMVTLRSKSKDSIIFASSASRPDTTINWLFTLNFNLKTMLGTKVQSGVANVRGDVVTFECDFEELDTNLDSGSLKPVDLHPT